LETILPTWNWNRNRKDVDAVDVDADVDVDGVRGEGSLGSAKNDWDMIVHALYHESEGCHIREIPQEGMNPLQIRSLLLHDNRKEKQNDDEDKMNNSHNNNNSNNNNNNSNNNNNVSFVGFNDKDVTRGWYAHGKRSETRSQSEKRAAAFYSWLCDYLDMELIFSGKESSSCEDVFDAGVSLPSEIDECEHDKFGSRSRKRRTVILMGHGDFMSLILKRVVGGFGHAVGEIFKMRVYRTDRLSST